MPASMATHRLELARGTDPVSQVFGLMFFKSITSRDTDFTVSSSPLPSFFFPAFMGHL